MTAYETACHEDLLQRVQVHGEVLDERDQRALNTLDAKARFEWENAPQPQWYGGDYPDAF